MQNQKMTFDEVMDAIFAKLAIRYGASWLRQWESVDIALVKADWAEELGGFARNLEPLRYALSNLPERCPSVGEFKALANRCPPPEFKQLPAPLASKKVVAEEIAKQAGLKRRSGERGDKAWAHALVERHEKGERIRPITLLFARQALGLVHV